MKEFNRPEVRSPLRTWSLDGSFTQNTSATRTRQNLAQLLKPNLYITDSLILRAYDDSPGPDNDLPVGYNLRTELNRISGTGRNTLDSWKNYEIVDSNQPPEPNGVATIYEYEVTGSALFGQNAGPLKEVGGPSFPINISQSLIYDHYFNNFEISSLPFGDYQFVAYHGYGPNGGSINTQVFENFQLRAIELTHFGMTVPAVDLNVPEPKVDIKGSITVYPNQTHTGISGWNPPTGAVVNYRIRIGHPDLDSADWIQLPDGTAATSSPDNDGVIASFLDPDIDLSPLVDAFAALTPPRPLPDILQVEGRAIMNTGDGGNTITPLAVAYIVDDDRQLRKDDELKWSPFCRHSN